MAKGDQVLSLNLFKGLNTDENPSVLNSNELSEVTNFDLGNRGQLEKRTGVRLLFNNTAEMGVDDSIHILGFFNTETFKQFIARSGNNLYYSLDAVTWTVVPGGPWADVEHGTQYVDKFYMVRRAGTILEWNGTAITAITNSPAGTFCTVFKDRMFVINTLGAGAVASRLYFSNALDVSSTGWPATNYVGVQEGDGDRLITIAQVSDYLLIFKARAVWNLFVQGSDTLSWILRPFRRDTGCVSKHSVVTREGVVYFCGLNGVYTTDGTDIVKISIPVNNFFDRLTTDITILNTISSFLWKDKYVIALPNLETIPLWNGWAARTWGSLIQTKWSASATANIYLVYHILNKGWTEWIFSTTSPYRFITVTALSDLKGVYCGERDLTGRVLKLGEDIYTDLGAPVRCTFETKNFDMDRPGQKKRGKWVAVEIVGEAVYNCIQIVDQLETSSIVRSTTSESILKIKGPGYFRNWRFGMEVNNSVPAEIIGISLFSTASDRAVKTSSI